MRTARFSEQYQLLATILGAAVAANTESNTGYVDCSAFSRVWVEIYPIALNDAVDIDVEEATDTDGTSAQAMDGNGKDTTILATDTAPTIIEIAGDEFDVNDKMLALNIEATTANTGGGSNYFLVAVWGECIYPPADTTTLDAVVD